MGTGVGHVRILYVDDEARQCAAFARSLTRLGCTVSTAVSGTDALLLLDKQRYEAVITDVQMPGMDGISLISHLRCRYPDTVLFAVSGGDLDMSQRRTLERCHAPLLKKPWKPSEFIQLLHERLDSQPTQESSTASVTTLCDVQVLMVEDNPADSALATRWLSNTKNPTCHVHATHLMNSAIAYLHDHTIDVIVLDLSLPDSRGLDNVKRLNVAAPQAAIVVLSGNCDSELELQAIRFGAQDYLCKHSVTEKSLARAVRFALQRRLSVQRMAHLAYHDPLTGLPNRVTFDDRLLRVLSSARRTNKQCGVMYVDLDNFKPVNDELGHEAGDLLLREVAGRLVSGVRNSDTVARLGGDEFGIILDNLPHESDLSRVITRLQQALAPPVSLWGTMVSISASIGVSVFPEAGDNPEALVRKADRAMYTAKANGGNRCEIYVPANTQRRHATARLHNDLRCALERQEFVLHYQPQVDIGTRAVVGAEALIRWQRPGGDLLPPAQFLPVLEENGMLEEVGAWVIRDTCKKIKELESRGCAARIAVNLSASQFYSSSLAVVVHEALHANGNTASYLELEISESTLLEEGDNADQRLDDLRRLGVRLAVDRVGIVETKPDYLAQFPVHTLKMHSSLTHAACHDSRIASDARKIIAMGSDSGLTVIGEGVENMDQLEFLKQTDCHAAQGFLLGHPQEAWSGHANDLMQSS